jgi:CSLREA domain-containing protein
MAALLSINLSPVFAAEITPQGEIIVDSFLDIDDNMPNSVCSVGDPQYGPCTLRSAIYEANQNIPDQDITIRLPAGVYFLTIPPSGPYSDNDSGDLNIDNFDLSNQHKITIEPLNGGQVIIHSNVDDRILSVGYNAQVSIKNLTMQSGEVFIEGAQQWGGGAIHNFGNLSLDGVSLLNNSVRCRDVFTCESNYSTGGAVYSAGFLEMINSTLDGNVANRGSAIFNTGISPDGMLNILYSTLSNNHSIDSGTVVNYGSMTVINSTFSNNLSDLQNNMSSSGILIDSGSLRMQSSTMTNQGWNNAILANNSNATIYLQDNLFKAGTGYQNCDRTLGTWTSGGYNIANDASCQLTATGDLQSVDPKLGSFGNWGGLTKTIMLNRDSPAVDHRPGNCQLPVNFLVDDQRHWARSDGKCDTGSYEFSPWYLYLPLISK